MKKETNNKRTTIETTKKSAQILKLISVKTSKSMKELTCEAIALLKEKYKNGHLL
jgi:hypothetical protein